jgi:hypothetical protein
MRKRMFVLGSSFACILACALAGLHVTSAAAGTMFAAAILLWLLLVLAACAALERWLPAECASSEAADFDEARELLLPAPRIALPGRSAPVETLITRAG